MEAVQVKVIPESVREAVAIVETVQGKGAVSDTVIDLMINIDSGEISVDDAIKEIGNIT